MAAKWIVLFTGWSLAMFAVFGLLSGGEMYHTQLIVTTGVASALVGAVIATGLT